MLTFVIAVAARVITVLAEGASSAKDVAKLVLLVGLQARSSEQSCGCLYRSGLEIIGNHRRRERREAANGTASTGS